MANTEPRVSIGLPVYNGETYLRESLESLLGQTCGDFELIISDNGSTDGTQDICAHYAKLDSRIAYHRVEENLGCAWNYNRVFELSRAEYFKWAADDDIHLPTFLEKAVDVLDQHPEVLWCFCRHSHIGPEGQLLSVAEGRNASLLSEDGWDRSSPQPHQRFQSVLLAHTGLDIYALHRRRVVAKTGVYQPHYGSEKVFLGELALLGKYYEIPETLFYLRVHPQASGSLTTEQQLQQYIDPRVKSRFTFMRWRLLRAHWQAVHRFDLGLTERLRCYLVLSRYLLQVSKWKKVLKATFRKQGTGGGYHSYLSEIEKESRQKTEDDCEVPSAGNACSVSLKTPDEKVEKIQCES